MADNQRYIVIGGEPVPVTEEVYLAYKRPLWAQRKRNERERRCLDENGNRCMKECRLCDKERTGGNLSLEKLTEDGHDFPDVFDLPDYIEAKLLKEALKEALASLTEDEQHLINVAFSGMSEREAAKVFNLSQKTFTYRRDKIVSKLRKYFS